MNYNIKTRTEKLNEFNELEIRDKINPNVLRQETKDLIYEQLESTDWEKESAYHNYRHELKPMSLTDQEIDAWEARITGEPIYFDDSIIAKSHDSYIVGREALVLEDVIAGREKLLAGW